MKFYIDDAGTGDILGDAIIGIYVLELNKYIFKRLSVNYYKEPFISEGYPERITSDLIIQGLKELDFNKNKDTIFICPGNIFNQARVIFKLKGYNYINYKIDNALQIAIEQEYIKGLEELGVSKNKISIKAGRERFYQLINWVIEDFYEREQYVKTGFPSWKRKWRSYVIRKYLSKIHKTKKSKRKN